MKRLKKIQLGHWCQFCEPKTNRAVFVGYGFDGFACNEHKQNLLDTEYNPSRDNEMSEADCQTWGRL